MIEIKLDSHNNDTKLWYTYADAGYSKSGHIGFREFVTFIVPGAKVTGTTADGLLLQFEDESEYTMFVLRWL